MTVLAIVLVLGGAVLVGVIVTRRFVGFRHVRVVTCPDTKATVAIVLEPWRATAFSLAGTQALRVRRCTHWPARMACRQECLSEVERAPDDCRVASVLRKWYADKTCSFCGVALSPIGIATHKPAVLSSTGETLEWAAIRPEKIHDVLSTHQPVCWDCHVIETLYRTHRELVVERPAGAPRKLLIH